MAENVQREVIGDPAHLAFDFGWPMSPSSGPEGLAWADLTLWVGGRRHWATEAGTSIRWTWVDLVEHLARAWGALLFEEVAPSGVTFIEPEKLRRREPPAGLTGAASEQFEARLFAFLTRHDLAAGLKGIFLPSLWLFREGKTMRIRAEGVDRWRPLQESIELLEQVADTILKQATSTSGSNVAPRTADAERLWRQRRPSASRVVQLRTALTTGELEEIGPEVHWSEVGDYEDTPFMAAARLSRALRPDTVKHLLSVLQTVQPSMTPDLDELTAKAGSVLSAIEHQKPYEEGHRMALWLRSELKNTIGPIDPERMLRDWNVTIQELPPLEVGLDAMACWGEEHGPAVLINPEGSHAQSPQGRRATLAHEIAHLLLDRGRQLPAAEVMGGSTPLHLEQRARAFAAELLLPREAAASALAQSTSFEEAATRLRTRFGVSNEVLGWQIRNGPGWESLPAQQEKRVRRWCRDWKDDQVLRGSRVPLKR